MKRKPDTEIEPIYKDARKGEVKHTQADLTNSSKFLGYKTKCTFRDGLVKTVEWYQKFCKK